jgi:hypothetical protein
MSAANYKDLVRHYGHKIVIAKYGDNNVAIECEDCCEVLFDFNRQCNHHFNIRTQNCIHCGMELAQILSGEFR